jgi:hypothetical protein
VDKDKASRERFDGDDLSTKYIINFYDQFKAWSFDQIVEEWKILLTQDLGEAFTPAFEGDAPADTPQGRAEEIFSQFETDKIILTSKFAECKEQNEAFANAHMRRAIALAVHQHAVMIALLGVGIMPSKDMQQHELLKSYWYGFSGLFTGLLYLGGKNKPAAELTDQVLKKLEIHTEEELEKSAIEDGVAKGVLKRVTLYTSGMLSKQFKECDWGDVHLQVQFKKLIKFGRGKDWIIRAKAKGGKWKDYSADDLGFLTKKGKPYELFETLKLFAKHGGFYNPTAVHGKASDNEFLQRKEKIKSRVKNLKAHLKKLFPIDGDPIPPYNKKDGSWQIKFAECKLSHRDIKTRPTNVQLDPEGKTIPSSSSDALTYLSDADDDEGLKNVDESGLHYDPNDPNNPDSLFDDPNELTDD